MVFIKDWKLIDSNPEVRTLYYTEMQREDGHPDFAYTQMKLLELDLEEKERTDLIRQALDKRDEHPARKKQKKVKQTKQTTKKRRWKLFRS